MKNEIFGPFDEDGLKRFASDLALCLKQGDCVLLHGDLGAGKTTFARAAIRAIAGDIDENAEVPSPTFTLVQSYETTPHIAHFDLYRISDSAEMEELGLGDALEKGVAFVEWPDRASDWFSRDAIVISIRDSDTVDDARLLTLSATVEFFDRLHHQLNVRAFLMAAGQGNAKRSPFAGDASARRYEHIYGNDGAMILMDAPRMPDGPPVYDGLPYSQVVHLAEDVKPFVAISNLLLSRGFAAPRIYAHDMGQGLLLLENLGSGVIVDDNNEPIAERYHAAIEVLADLHREVWQGTCDLPDGSTHTIPRYDVRAMTIGLSLLPDWWGKEHGLSSAQAETLLDLWRPIFEGFQSGYDDLIIRDYHSPNIIWRGERQGKNRIGIIDHQDAMIGPGAYDLASLIQDARTVVPVTLQRDLLDRYCHIRLDDAGFDALKLRRDVATLCAFRNSRLLGLWVRLDVRDGKPRFRGYIEQTRIYLAQALEHPDLAHLRTWYEKAGIIDG